MDGISTSAIVGVLIAALKKIADPVVKDSYDAIKKLIKKKFGHEDKINNSMEEFEKDPEKVQHSLENILEKMNVQKDSEIIKAVDLLRLVINQSSTSNTFHSGTGDILKDHSRKINVGGDYIEGDKLNNK